VTPLARAAADLAALPRVHDTVVHMLAAAAERAPDRPALVCGERTLSYDAYRRCVGGFAAERRQLGAAGGRVALVLGNGIEMTIALFAAHTAGAQAVPINPIYTARELRHILADAEPEVVLYDGTAAETVVPLADELAIPKTICADPVAGRRLDAWQDDGEAALPLPLPAPGDLASLQYTGGTTGLPKGVDIAHGQMAVNISQREALLPTIPEGERVLCVMPLFHVYAISMALHLACYCRGTLVILPRYEPKAVLDAIAEHRITILPGGPTIFTGLMAYEGFEAADLSSLRICYSGSAPLPAETLKRWETATGCPILEGFGQTESGPVLAFNPQDGVRKPASVGVVVPATEIEIVDADTGTRVLPTGEAGEIRARGPQIMSGYRNRPADSAAALREGWLYTGDIGEVDGDGYLYIRDRKKDMVIVGGYNVYPREVDEVLYAHPAVLEAAAVGVPDDYRGEVVRARVVLKPGANVDAEALLEHCRANLAKFKVPAALEIVDQLPKTTVGKVDKLALRAQLCQSINEGRPT
jgi:long-chain acyl-CoA synthetase